MQESRTVDTIYCGSGVPVRIGNVKTIEKVISLTTDYERQGLVTPLAEAWVGYAISGGPWSGQSQERPDHLMVVMRRGDLPVGTFLSGTLSGGGVGVSLSGALAQGLMSGITSGLAWMGELLSGVALVSGKVTVVANVIAF
ncbi:MAG: hypothetical protein Q7T57_02775 [Dehalococcoidales bacterium]|nr:hypothetical protein [Dehalococcoidales bacterium]